LCKLPNKHSSYHTFGTIGKLSMWKGVRYQVHTWTNDTCYTSMISVKVAKVSKLSIKSCPIGHELHPSFNVSSFLGYCLQKHEILLNKGVKYWNFGLNGLGSKTFITRVHILTTMIYWKHLGKERIGQIQFNTKTVTKLSFVPHWSPMYFFCVFWNLIPYVTKKVLVPSLSDFMDNFIIIMFIWSHILRNVHQWPFLKIILKYLMNDFY